MYSKHYALARPLLNLPTEFLLLSQSMFLVSLTLVQSSTPACHAVPQGVTPKVTQSTEIRFIL